MSISSCECIDIAPSGQELTRHGSGAFPAACYQDNLSVGPVPWHWHEELEAIIVDQGAVRIGCGECQNILKEGQGVLINSGVLHGCWQQGRDPLPHSLHCISPSADWWQHGQRVSSWVSGTAAPASDWSLPVFVTGCGLAGNHINKYPFRLERSPGNGVRF